MNRPVEFFGGSYIVSEEGKMPCQGKEVLYFVGIAGLEASCCGRSGGAFAKVPGFIVRWKTRKNESGLAVSEVDRIKDEKRQREIIRLLKEKYPQVTQIEFL
ncbi:MAG: hypothetical protein H6Q42_4208 [Deltaproteobacteria bacterium]|nr:hypothetical protein [Deltaproteobacteria bacterium]